MQLVITLPSHLEQWLREKFREDVREPLNKSLETVWAA